MRHPGAWHKIHLIFLRFRRKKIHGLLVKLALATIGVTLSIADVSQANTAQEARARVATTYPNGLPNYLTPEERELPIPRPLFRGSSPPSGTVRCPAEYEPQEGLLLAWSAYSSLLTDITLTVTNENTNAYVMIVVASEEDETRVSDLLRRAGAAMDRVRFTLYDTDTVWIRDYGPRYIFEDGVRKIVDYTYNRPRPRDDKISDYLSEGNDYDMPLVHAGGNFHVFSNGDAFTTTLIQNENPDVTAEQIQAFFYDYEHVHLTIYPAFPADFDSTQHIDMWMLPVKDHEVIIAQYDPKNRRPHEITEAAVLDLKSRGYRVYRTPGWHSGLTHYTYTNAILLNNQVLIPRYGGKWKPYDEEALKVFKEAFPERTLYQLDASDIVHAAGVLHCIAMQIPAPSDNNVQPMRLTLTVKHLRRLLNPFALLTTSPRMDEP